MTDLGYFGPRPLVSSEAVLTRTHNLCSSKARSAKQDSVKKKTLELNSRSCLNSALFYRTKLRVELYEIINTSNVWWKMKKKKNKTTDSLACQSFFIQFYAPFNIISVRKRENPREKPPGTPASRTWLVSHVARAGLEPTPDTAVR